MTIIIDLLVAGYLSTIATTIYSVLLFTLLLLSLTEQKENHSHLTPDPVPTYPSTSFPGATAAHGLLEVNIICRPLDGAAGDNVM